ncbi:MAG TPA: 5-formyltetrahydrofolate cyclo-ligase [Rectinemataceae bacterium]|nr:5-formyltetrahydrofolate cyclo-ligase [Rectinemataceae bacterium]
MHRTETKAEARKAARAALASLDEASAQELSRRAAEQFRSLPEFDPAALILAFLSMPGEIKTDSLIEASFAAGKRVAVPRIEGADIGFVTLAPDYRSWPRDRFGIPEPPAALTTLSPEQLRATELLVATPGLAFDRGGGRLGRGKGYYDRFLASLHDVQTSGSGRLTLCGFCYSIQVFDFLPRDSHDVPMDAIATELGIIRPRAEDRFRP